MTQLKKTYRRLARQHQCLQKRSSSLQRAASEIKRQRRWLQKLLDETVDDTDGDNQKTS